MHGEATALSSPCAWPKWRWWCWPHRAGSQGDIDLTHTFSRLLLATEHGEFDAGSEALAFVMAQRCGLPLAAVLPVVSNPEFEAVAPELAAKADAEASVRREQLESRARAAGVTMALRVRHGAEPYAEIVEEARQMP